MITMVNIGGYGKNVGGTQGVNRFEYNSKGRKPEKENGKKANTDVADFSSVLKNNQKDNTYSAMKVGSASEKTDGLSSTAKDYLEKLKKKYGNMDFIISDFSSDEEADKLLAKGKGEYNVLITPDLLEKMAADESVAAEYEGIIESSVDNIKQAKEELGDDADMVEKWGVTVNSDGEVSLRAKLLDGLTDKDGNNTVKASTIGELLDRLNEVKEQQSEKLAKIREERAEAAKKEAEKLAEEKKQAEEALKVEDKSDEMAQYASFSAEA